MKKKTIRRIAAGIFVAVMVIAALPQVGVSAYAKTSLPVKKHSFTATWLSGCVPYYEFKITGNKFYYEDCNMSGEYHGWVRTRTRSYGTIYDVKKVSNKKYTFRIRNNAKKNNRHTTKVKYDKDNNGEEIEYANVFKNGTKMTLYLPGYRVLKLPENDCEGYNQLLYNLYENYTANELMDKKLKGYAVNTNGGILLDDKAESGLYYKSIRGTETE